MTKCRKHMPYFPPLASKGDCTYRKAKATLAVMWKNKHEVTLLTTIHHPQMVLSHNIDNSTRQRIMKPECVLDYNTNMHLVVKADAMFSSIECACKTLKWYKKQYFHLVDITMLNVHVLFKEKTYKNPTLQDFVIKVVRQLLEENAVEHPTQGLHVVDNPVCLTGQHFPCTLQPRPDRKKKKVQKACHVCSLTKRQPRKRSDTRYCCHECNVALCIEPCFAEYHTLLQY